MTATPPHQLPPYMPTPLSQPNPSPHHRAALFGWLLGGLTVLLFSCCSCMFGLFASIPHSEAAKIWKQSQAQSGGQMNDEQIQLLIDAHPEGMAAIAVIALVFGLLPGLGVALLGFAVRQAKRWAVIISLVLVGIHTLPMLVLTPLSMIGSLIQGDLLGMLFALLVFGGLLTLQTFTLWFLWRALQSPTAPTGHEPPWGTETPTAAYGQPAVGPQSPAAPHAAPPQEPWDRPGW